MKQAPEFKVPCFKRILRIRIGLEGIWSRVTQTAAYSYWIAVVSPKLYFLSNFDAHILKTFGERGGAGGVDGGQIFSRNKSLLV
jgi:hypothetical protein